MIGNPFPEGGNEDVTQARGPGLIEVWFLDADTYLGPVRSALRAHCAHPAAADPVFPQRRKGRRAGDAAFRGRPVP